MKPARFVLHFEAEGNRDKTAIANYRVYGEPIGIYRLDDHPERNFATVAALLAALAPAELPAAIAGNIETALNVAGGHYAYEVSERQATAVRLGF